ncbi:DnaD domain protein [Leuconostoc pseudomesenteroides]|uniref:DnaD domain protein n=1 Tax=Leuconostoc pseudomesenteroides TaxID=33968 RepID=UPI00301DAF76
MEFGKQRKAFRTWKISHVGAIKSSANSLYHELLDFAFDLGKPKFDLTNDSLRMMAGYSSSKADETKLANDRNRLVELGLIKYQKGVKNQASPVYEIVALYGEEYGEPMGNIMDKPRVKTVDKLRVKPRVKTVANNTKTDSLTRLDNNNKDVEKVDDVVFVETSTSQKLSSYWQQIVMTTINGNQIQDLAQDAQDFGEHGVELVQRAIDITANAGAKSFKYYSAIVNDWSQKGVKILGDVDMLAQQRQKSKQFSQGSKAFGRKSPIIEPQLASVTSKATPEVSEVDFDALKNKLANIKTHT